jgi:uncharacterized membrane protein
MASEKHTSEIKDADRWVALILRIGAYGSVALLLIGLLLWAAISGPLGVHIMRVGVLLLMATPVLRIITLLLLYLHARDWKYALISFTVLLIVMVSSLLGLKL